MTGALYRVGGFAARRAPWVLGAWIAFAVAIVLMANATGRPTNDDTTIPGSDSTKATDLLEQKLPGQANGSVPIVLQALSGKLTEGSNRTAVQRTVQSLKASRYVHDVISPRSQQGASELAEKDTLGFISVFLTVGPGDLDEDQANQVFDAADPAREAGLEVSAGGYLGTELSMPSTRLSEIVGIVAAMIVQQQSQQQEQFLSSPASDPRLVKLENAISNTNDVDQVSPASLNQAGTAAAFSAVPDSAPTARRTRDLVDELRDDVIPKALQGTEMTAYVGGTTAANIDLADRIGEKLPVVIAIIVALSFLLLTLAFRTMVVPALAAAMNLLAVAAAYGVLVAMFQKGWGVELLGLDHSIPIVSFVPLMMFAILFGLSTVEGLGRAARVIVAAAGIMVLVFASFILSGNPTVKQFGVGLAVAVAVDATIVCLVLPGLMLLVGRACWWLPGPIERHLPPLGIEGDEYFKERAPAGGKAPGS